jgi:hypothetical protein
MLTLAVIHVLLIIATAQQAAFIQLLRISNGSSSNEALERWCTEMVPRTLLAAPECKRWRTHKLSPPPRKFLITGSGRSGTLFVTQLLLARGIAVAHDTRGSWKRAGAKVDGAVSWVHAFSARDCAPRWAWTSARVSFRKVVHIVRHPLKAIASRWNKGHVRPFRDITRCNTAAELPGLLGTVEQILGATFGMSPADGVLSGVTLGFTLQHWTLWNLFVEAQSSSRVRVESIDTIGDLCDFVSHRSCFESSEVAPHNYSSTFRIHSAHTRTSTVTWNDLLNVNRNHAALAQRMATRYGYEVSSPDPLASQREMCLFERDGRWNCALENDT